MREEMTVCSLCGREHPAAAILERYAPILFAGKNFREDNAASTKAAARRIVSP